MTANYYLSDVESGGETAFPAADGAMSPAEAMALREPAAEGVGLVVRPERGAALLWYNHDADGQIDPAAVHAGCRVLAGEKWGANHWVRLSAQPPAAAAAPAGEPEQKECDADESERRRRRGCGRSGQERRQEQEEEGEAEGKARRSWRR